MESKILQVFYGNDALPYKDQERTVHYPIVGNGFQGANNTTQIKFYFSSLGDSSVTWVAVSKLPNGKIGSKVLQTYNDSELGEPYALLELDSFYTQYKGDVFISLQGYQGGVQVDYDSESELYVIHGTPTIQATGSIKFTNNYATQFVGSGEEENADLQSLMAALGLKANASETLARYTSAFGSVTLQTLYNKFGYNIFLLNTGGSTNIDYLMQFQVSSGSLSGVTLIRLSDLRKWYATLGTGGQLTLSNYVSDLATNTYLTHITTEEYANDIVDALRSYIAINYATKTYVDDQDDAIKNYADAQDNSLKTYVDTQDNKKLDKVNTSDTKERVYGITPIGGQTTYSIGSGANDIVKRDYNGQIQVPMNPYSSLDAVSKSYVDSMISTLASALKYKGSLSVAQINALTGLSIGDVYNVSDSGTLTQGDVQVNAGDNVAWDGSKWDKLSSDIDLSAYYNKTETDALLGEKQDALVSGTNIKTINNQSILGSGNITIQGTGGDYLEVISRDVPITLADFYTAYRDNPKIILTSIGYCSISVDTDGQDYFFEIECLYNSKRWALSWQGGDTSISGSTTINSIVTGTAYRKDYLTEENGLTKVEAYTILSQKFDFTIPTSAWVSQTNGVFTAQATITLTDTYLDDGSNVEAFFEDVSASAGVVLASATQSGSDLVLVFYANESKTTAIGGFIKYVY